MTISVGETIPDVTLMTPTADGPQPVQSTDVLGSGRVVLFAVPGAFTPTCSMKHLPGFVDQDKALRAKGADEVVCISVNDAFVMDAWGKSSSAGGKVRMLADGNGEFTHAMGLTTDASKFGLGTRSQRYAMIVQDGVIKDLFVEKPGAFEVSAAENVLKHL